ncbi:MAG: dipicolinate synthase subunit B [Oscillospiraceae bacterium]|nr:dipicolinate synthase subunit B [Oscillospiraceae bacterium]
MVSDNPRIGFAMTGSFCTFRPAFEAAEALVSAGYNLTPIMSFNAYNLSTRFGTAEENRAKLETITGKEIIHTIESAEPIGPKRLFDLIVICPCTSNTIAKLSNGINDTPVTMAVKSHLRNQRPVVIAVSTNDALSNAAKNIGILESMKHYYFVPYRQDDYILKPFSMVADFSKMQRTIELALSEIQLQPMIENRIEK